MNRSDLIRLLDIAERRALTLSERDALRGWMAAHPEDGDDWTIDLSLSHTLIALPDAPVSPRFTADVLAAVEAAEVTAAPGRQRGVWRARLRPLVLGWRAPASVRDWPHWRSGLRCIAKRKPELRARMAESVAAVAAVADLPDPEALAEFELGLSPAR